MFNRIFAAAAVGSMMIAGPAFAEDTEVTTATVNYGDLDLTSKKGQAVLERRIASTVRAMCGADDVRTGTRVMSADTRNCLAKAKKSVKSQIAAVTEDAGRGG